MFCVFSGRLGCLSGHLLLNKELVPSYVQQIPTTVNCPLTETSFVLFGKTWLVQTGFHWFQLICCLCFPSKCVFFFPHHNSNRRWLILWQSCDQSEQSMYSSLERTNKQSSQRIVSAAAAVYIKVSENEQTQEATFTLALIMYCLRRSNVAVPGTVCSSRGKTVPQFNKTHCTQFVGLGQSIRAVKSKALT